MSREIPTCRSLLLYTQDFKGSYRPMPMERSDRVDDCVGGGYTARTFLRGSNSGIGAGIALRFAELGCSLVLTGRDAHKLKEIGQSCQDRGLDENKVLLVTCDMTIDADVDRLLQETIEHYGRLDILINNAGRPGKGRYQEIDMEFFDDITRLNFRSAVYLSKLAIPHLKENKGCVVNISSVASKTLCDYNPSYQVSKAALDHFTKSLAVELGPSGIRVNALNPGIILTPLFNKLGLTNEQVVEWSKDMHPIGRHGTVEEVAKAAAYLASDEARCITGCLLSIDGGRFLM